MRFSPTNYGNQYSPFNWRHRPETAPLQEMVSGKRLARPGFYIFGNVSFFCRDLICATRLIFVSDNGDIVFNIRDPACNVNLKEKYSDLRNDLVETYFY